MCCCTLPHFGQKGVGKVRTGERLEKEGGKLNISLIRQFRHQGLQMEIKMIYSPFLFYSSYFNINTVCNGI